MAKGIRKFNKTFYDNNPMLTRLENEIVSVKFTIIRRVKYLAIKLDKWYEQIILNMYRI